MWNGSSLVVCAVEWAPHTGSSRRLQVVHRVSPSLLVPVVSSFRALSGYLHLSLRSGAGCWVKCLGNPGMPEMPGSPRLPFSLSLEGLVTCCLSPLSECPSHKQRMPHLWHHSSLGWRLKDLLGPVTRVKKEEEVIRHTEEVIGYPSHNASSISDIIRHTLS